MTECTCTRCIECCKHNPGWMTPEEAAAAIDAGHSGRLMLDWLEPCDELKNKKRIYILAPASIGHEGSNAPEMPSFDLTWSKGRCTFLKNNRCEIHNSGFKPLQCRESLACNPSRSIGYLNNYAIAPLWKTGEAKSIVKRWKSLL